MQTFLEQNLMYIRESKPFLEGLASQEDDLVVELGESKNGEVILKIRKDDYLFSLNSEVCASDLAQRWAEQFEDVTEYTTFVMIGLSNGCYLDALREKYPKNVFIVYEPSPAIFRKWLELEDRKEIIESDCIYLSVGHLGRGMLRRYYGNLIQYTNLKMVQWNVIPGYYAHFGELIVELFDGYSQAVKSRYMDCNTMIKFGRDRTWKYLQNLYDIKDHSSVDALENSLKKEDITARPAVLIAAGPSLDKNIELLKKLKNHCLLIAVDSAIRPLEKHHIKPDLMITIDSKKPLTFVQTELGQSLPLIMESTANAEVSKYHKGKRFYSTTGEFFTQEILNRFDKTIGSLTTGGSVANNALSFLQAVGFKTIIFIGQDLAYEENRTHAEGTFVKAGQTAFSENVEYLEVEGYYGAPVLTEYNMISYRKWIEEEILGHSDICYINATEGGALIHGANNMSFSDAIKEYCEGFSEISFDSIIEQVEPLLTETEKEEYKKALIDLRGAMERDKERIKRGILAYEDMNRLKTAGREKEKNFKKAYGVVSKTIDWLNKLPERMVLEMYEAEEDYEIQGKVLQVKSNQEEEWDEVIELGIRTFSNYVKAIEDFLEDTQSYECE